MTIDVGVLAGANSPNQPSTSYPGKPDSAIVGRSGANGARLLLVTAIARNRPRTAAELLAIPGIGIGAVEKYGAQIYRILNETRD